MKIKEKNIYAFLAFIISITVYLFTLSPTVTFTDNGELVTTCITLGVGHPSGYPLFVILGHIFSLLPLPFSKIYQMNLLAAIYSSLSVVVFYYLVNLILNNINSFSKNINSKVKHKKKHDLPQSQFEVKFSESQIYILSFFSSLILGFSAIFWSQATSLEVYSLQLLLIEITLFFSVKSFISKEHKHLFLTALFLGFAFSNHLTTILILPSILYLFFKDGNTFDFSSSKFKQLGKLLLVALIGISLYLYLPIRSASHPVMNWGEVHRGLDKLLYHIQGKQYQVWMFQGANTMIENIGKFLASLPYNLGILGLLTSLAGIYFTFKHFRILFWFLVFTFISVVLYSSNYSIHDIDVYFLSAFMVLVIFTPISFLFLPLKGKTEFFPIAIIIFSLYLNYSECDESKNYLVHDYTMNVLKNVEPNAIIISSQYDYWLAASWYFQKVEHFRTDVSIIDKELLRRTWYPYQIKNWYPDIYNKSAVEFKEFAPQLEKFEEGKDQSEYPLIQEKYVALLKSFIIKNIKTRPIYITYDVLQTENYITEGYQVIPAGFAMKLQLSSDFQEPDLNNIRIDRIIEGSKNKENHLVSGLLETSSLNLTNLGIFSASIGKPNTAKVAYLKALKLNPQNELAQRNLRQIR